MQTAEIPSLRIVGRHPGSGPPRPAPQHPAPASRPAFSQLRSPRAVPVRASEIAVAGIALKLGMANRPLRATIDRIRLLVDRCGFPLPKTPRFVKGERQTGGRAVDARSVWSLDEVETWFDGDLPPAAAAAQAEVRGQKLRDQLAANARTIAAPERALRSARSGGVGA